MTNTERKRPGRPRRAELSERQREVLDLLVAGHTNSEIAEALGISLDGAKYHVRELCDRIGVDTREEAAEWWRQERGLPARFTILPEWQRLPRPVRWAALGSAGLAACAVAAVALLFVFRDDSREGLDPGVWLAIVVPLEPTAEQAPPSGEIHVTRLSSSDDSVISEPGFWASLALSPSGSHLFATEMTGLQDSQPTVVLHIFDLERGTSIAATWPHLWSSVVGGVWSPDSSAVAIPADPWAGVMELDGTVRATEFARDDGTLTGGARWRPDSSGYAYTYASDALVIVDRSANVVAQVDASGWPERFDKQRQQQIAWLNWVDGETFELYLYDRPATFPEGGDVSQFRLTGQEDGAGSIEWLSVDAISSDELVEAYPAPADGPALTRETISGVPGFQNAFLLSRGTSSGLEFTGAFVVRGDPGGPTIIGRPIPTDTDLAFLTEIDGRPVEFPLGPATDSALAQSSNSFVRNWDMIRVE